MKHVFYAMLFTGFISPEMAFCDPVFYINQVAYDARGAKTAVIGNEVPFENDPVFSLENAGTGTIVFQGSLSVAMQIEEWRPGVFYYGAIFSKFTEPGSYRLQLNIKGKIFRSDEFRIGENALAVLTIPAILHYYRKQRANTPAELEADKHVKLWGSEKTVDMHGGWCDASGDVSKYFSHLAYANFMSPQQTPLVTWSLVSATESIPHLLASIGMKDSIVDEALWGADYLMRALSDSGYFRMIIFSYFKKDPAERRVVGLLANSVTTTDYQCAFREGGGMAIAALARISRWKKNGDFTSQQYLDGARRAFDHLLINNTRYDDDGKENIIDDYCALMAASELWMATGETLYQTEARKRAGNLCSRMTDKGYFRADDGNRPFWHASDAGLPVIALARYLVKETDSQFRLPALDVISKALHYYTSITYRVTNPFGYARQSFLFRGAVKDGFFIPHENETGWWWQGEDARLASLATAALVGGRLVYPANTGWHVKDQLAYFASRQISWILGSNPYSVCFMYQFGNKNTPNMTSNFGHGSERGGISNGITGRDGNADGTGIDYKTSAGGNEWRWTEQWIPHAAWFLQAIAAMADENMPVTPGVDSFKN